jgi:large subunit ribosomal protein L2
MLENYFFYNALNRLAISLKHRGGRNLLGRICVFHRGGAARRRCCRLDVFRRVQSFALVCRVFKESLRSSFSAFVLYKNGLFSFISASESAGLGATLYSGTLPLLNPLLLASHVFVPGSALPLESINLFHLVHNVELFAFSGFKVARAAGGSALLSNKMPRRCFLKLSSG